MIELKNLTKSYATPKGRHYVFKDLNAVLPADVDLSTRLTKKVSLNVPVMSAAISMIMMIDGVIAPRQAAIPPAFPFL